jgi:peptidoglycan/LPS O-acetylase OafA/YrhL
MALGGIAAYVIFHFGNHAFFQSKYRKLFLFVTAFLALTILFVHTKTTDNTLFATIIKSLVFALFLLFMGVKNQATKVGEHKWLVYFGEISYGIYMYHLVVLTGLVELMKVIQIHPVVDTAIYLVLAIGITIGVAALSKATFENYFLKFKPK